MAETVYRLIAGEGIQLIEESGTRTVTVAVPGLSQKINVGDIGQASRSSIGLIEIAEDAEVQAMADLARAVTPSGLGAASQSNPYDGTPGRLLKAGAGGLLYSHPGGLLNFNDLVPGTFASAVGVNTQAPSYNWPLLSGSAPVWWNVVTTGNYDRLTQIAMQAYDTYGNRVFIRRRHDDKWSVWQEFWTAANFDPNSKANTSGYYPAMAVGDSSAVNGQTAAMLAPPGAMVLFASNSAPSGWLKANGAEVSRTTYANLFAAIGTIWGAGNGSTTFNLPDWRGEFGRGWDDGRGLDSGRAFASVQAGQNQLHGHTATGAGAHTHQMSTAAQYSTFDDPPNATVSYLGGDSNASNLYGGNSTLANGGYITSAGDHTHPISLEGGEARPRNVAGLWCIKF